MLIYGQILGGHLTAFSREIQALRDPITSATIELHRAVTKAFLPTAIKFHYEFNLRHISNVFEGLLLTKSSSYTEPAKLVRLWFHECCRVYRDRLVSTEDSQQFNKLATDVAAELRC